MGFISERKNILVLSAIVIAVIIASLFTPLCPDSLKSQERLLKEIAENPSELDLNGISSLSDLTSAQQEEKDIPADAVLYCEWSWPQKIINKETKEVYWTCSPGRGYCKPGTSQCCDYESSTKTYFDCAEMNQ